MVSLGSGTAFSIAQGVTPLPVEYLSLTAKPKGENILVEWSTASETNNSGFELQRYTGAEPFQPIGWIDGQGTTSQTTQYRYLDKNVSFGKTYYYRLRQVDFDGIDALSDIVSAKLEVLGVSVSAWPNPFGQTTNIVLSVDQALEVDLFVVNALGQRIADLTKGLTEPGKHLFEFDRTAFGPGVYSVMLKAGDRTEHMRIVSFE
jgi:hypothetical protein